MAKVRLNKMSLNELQAEVRRRQRELNKLQAQREKAAARLTAIDKKITELNGDALSTSAAPAAPAKTGKKTRRRPRNQKPLAEVLLNVIPNDKPIKVADAVAAVKKSGYKTTATNFSTIVNQALIKDDRFKQVSRGHYQLA